MPLPTAITEQDELLTLNVHETLGVPVSETVRLKPLFLDRENGVWVVYGWFGPGTILPTHYHTGTVHFFTTKGRWNYLEYPGDAQVAGSYLYEPGGSIHTFSVPDDATEPAEGFMVVSGANVNFVDGTYHSMTDASSLAEAFRSIAAAGIADVPAYFAPGGRVAAIAKSQADQLVAG